MKVSVMLTGMQQLYAGVCYEGLVSVLCRLLTCSVRTVHTAWVLLCFVYLFGHS